MYYNFIKNLDDFKDRKIDKSNYLLETSLDKVSPYSKKDIIFKINKLHSVFDSMVYSLTLLRYNTPNCISTAINITKSILNAKEKDKSSPYCGLWLYDLETDMYAHGFPEKNLTSAIGIPLFIQYKEFSHLFPADLISDMKDVLIRACFAIIHRNVDLQASHIIIAETFLTAVCGYYFNLPELSYYSMNKLQNFYFYNIAHGNFYTFNAPYHYSYSLTVIHFEKLYLKNADYNFIIDQIANDIWQILITHYNANLSLFTGPSMRMLEKVSNKELIEFFQTACLNPSHSDTVFSLKGLCPVQYRSYFNGTKKPTYSQKLIFSGCTYPFYAYPQVATTLIEPNFDIGSFCRCQCWKEHAPFLAHFGCETSPYTVTVNALYNGFEFTSAQLSIVQHFNYALGHITFATNKATKHIDYDATYGAISPSDFRIRFEISGDTSKLNVQKKNNTLEIRHNETNLIFNYSYAVFNNKTIPVKLTRNKDSLYFDLIIHKGKAKRILLEKLKTTIFAWSFCISDNKIPSFNVNNKLKHNTLISTMITKDNVELQLESLHSPDTFENIHSNNVHKIADIKLENFVLNNNIHNKQLSFLANNDNNNSVYDSLINEKDDINQKLQSLTMHPEKDFVMLANDIFSLIIQNNTSLNIAKRIAIQMLIIIYDYYKNVNIQFEAIISSQTSITQLYISLSTTIETIAEHTISALKLLHTHYTKIQNANDGPVSIDTIVTLINENFANHNLSLEYISKEFGISTFAISRLFQQKLNIKYTDYVTNIRISHAKQLLEQTKLPMTEICSKSGYIDQSTFYRAFKKIAKETPAQYRKRIKQ